LPQRLIAIDTIVHLQFFNPFLFFHWKNFPCRSSHILDGGGDGAGLLLQAEGQTSVGPAEGLAVLALGMLNGDPLGLSDEEVLGRMLTSAQLTNLSGESPVAKTGGN